MNKLLIEIHAYKHNGSLYRCFKKVLLLEQNNDFFITYMYKSPVFNKNSKWWIIQRPSLGFFFKKEWFNFTVTFNNEFFERIYCNLASPSIFEENTIKYIDYDLDLRKIGNKPIRELDVLEFEENAKKYMYHQKIIDIVKKTTKNLKVKLDNLEDCFDLKKISPYWEKYRNEIKYYLDL